MSTHGSGQTVSFTRMDQGTPEDYALLNRLAPRCNPSDECLRMLGMLKGDKHGLQVDRYEHSLQSATRALRDNADNETIVCALLHDIGDVIALKNHAQFIAAVMRPYISEKNHWILKHHAIFQGYYYFHCIGLNRNARNAFLEHPYYQDCVNFCEKYDMPSFDPHYDTMPLDRFEPLVHKLFIAPVPEIF